MAVTVDLRDVYPRLEPVIDLRTSTDGPPPVGTTPLDAPYVVSVTLRGRGNVVPDTVTLLGWSEDDVVRFAQALFGVLGRSDPLPARATQVATQT